MNEPLPGPIGFVLEHNHGFGWTRSARICKSETTLLQVAKVHRVNYPDDDLRAIAFMPETEKYGRAFEILAFVWPRGREIIGE